MNDVSKCGAGKLECVARVPEISLLRASFACLAVSHWRSTVPSRVFRQVLANCVDEMLNQRKSSKI